MKKMMSDKKNYSLETKNTHSSQEHPEKYVWIFSKSTNFWQKTATSLMLSLKNYQIWKVSDVVK